MKFEATPNGKDEFALSHELQCFADDYWLPEHEPEDQGRAIILEAFKRKVAGQIELLDLQNPPD